MSELKSITVKDIEDWREYDFTGRLYRIEKPVKIEFRENGETHRVTDSAGVVHCVPAPGKNGCVLRWKGAVVA